MIKRQLEKTLKDYAKKFSVVAVVGPRQSGKTTLVKKTFPKYRYISLENSDIRLLARQDPKQFLYGLIQKSNVIIDEFQHVPEILSYIQTIVDDAYKPGQFILTGSQNFLLNQEVSQTLAGRIGILTLLPFSIKELQENGFGTSNLEKMLLFGGYPRIYAQNFKPDQWLPSYIQTYVERDVRLIKNITDLSLFQKFLQLCAGRVGQLLNLSSIGNDCGITSQTAHAWLSILEASYIVFLLKPYYKNFSKRLIKSPKLYFYDTGLVCSLLGIESEDQLIHHYLRGGLFESFILSDIMKNFYNKGKIHHVYFWRDSHGNELDCIIENGPLIPLEIKSGKTISNEYFTGLNYWNMLNKSSGGYIVYAGDEDFKTGSGTIISWRDLPKIFNKLK